MDHGPNTDHVDLTRADAYGRSFADVYDRWYHDVSDADATAAFVAARCSGPVLELGVGSGRLARPLAELGLSVIGLDGSTEMLDQCRDGGGDIHLVCADMRALPFHGSIGAALIAFNTVFNLASEQQQLELFKTLRPLVDSGGVVIVEALDVSPLLAGPERSIGVRDRSDNRVVVTATAIDQNHQLVTGQHLEIDDAGIAVRPWRLRWLTPEQLDGLASAAGLVLAERYRSWDEEPFGPDADTHISVYVAAPDPSVG
jgi:SAM-dependent methyltransferase